ncbi:MAG TPA: hypothetical protein VGB89_07040 [Bacteroidota bacterium]
MTEKDAEQIRGEYVSLGILLLLLVVGRLLQYYLSGFANDDGYITFRYARNIAEGNGFVYNLGERVLGTTTPLWTILLSVSALLFGSVNIPAASVTLSVAADIAIVVVLWRIGRKASPMARILPVLLFLLYPKVILICGSGMEASLVVALMVGAFAFFTMERHQTAAFVLGLLLLTRFDGAIWSIVLLGWLWVQHKSFPWKELLVIASVVLPWLVFSQFYFGSVIPHSLIAKSVSYSHLFPVFDPLRVLTGYLPFESLRVSSIVVRLPFVLLMLVPVGIELIRLWRRRSSFVVWPAFFLLYALTFSFARVILHDWYYLPGFVSYFVTCSTFAEHLFSQVAFARKEFTWWANGLALVAFAAFFVVIAFRFESNVGTPFENEYGDLARYFRDKSKSSIFIEPIGYAGWLSDSYIHDPVGIVSPDVVAYRLTYPGSDQWWMSFVKASLPDYVVLRMAEVKQNTLYLGHGENLFSDEAKKEWFKENYGEVSWPNRTAINFFVFRKKPASTTDLAAAGQ